MEVFDLKKWPGFFKAGGKTQLSSFIDQIVTDTRRIDSINSLFVALPGAYEDGHHFLEHAAKAGAKFALIKDTHNFQNQYPSLTLLKVDDPLRAFQQIVKCYRQERKSQIIAIGGSYGKTMVKDLLLLMVSQNKKAIASPESFNSQIGVPLSLLTIREEHELALIEAGFSQANEMDHLTEMIQPNCAILTHLGKRHLPAFGSIELVTKEITKLIQNISSTGWILVPQSLPLLPLLKHIQAKCYFWDQKYAELPHASLLTTHSHPLMDYKIEFPDGQEFVSQISSGFYYFLDLLNITIKAAWLLGVNSTSICQALKDYTPEPIRTEIWRAPTGTTFINDSYCSDPQSVDNALRLLEQTSLGQRNVFVFGGLREQQSQSLESDYKRVGKAINRSSVKLLFLVGSHSYGSLIEQIQLESPHIEIVSCQHFQQALTYMRSRLRADDTVLIKGDRKQPLDLLTETFNESICNNQYMINLAAIELNLITLRKKLPSNNRIMVMVKAFAYGMDDIRIAKFLQRCKIDILGVSYVDEGVALRRAGVQQNIFVINAASYEASKVVKWNLEVGIHDRQQINSLQAEAAKQNKKVKVHLHIDTGMSRFGCRPEAALALGKEIMNSPSLIFEGLMTHFASADNPHHDNFTRLQSQIFDQVIAEFKKNHIEVPWLHAANSSAVIRFNFPQYNMVRIGLAMYGLHSSEATKKEMELRLALSLISRIVGINYCYKGETISYGRSYTVQKEVEKIAVLPIGYFDGLHRKYSGKGQVIVRGKKVPMVGKICMDYMMIDVTEIDYISPGDPVLIFGEDEYGQYLSPEELALSGDSIIYELITCLGPRIQRVFVHEVSNSKLYASSTG